MEFLKGNKTYIISGLGAIATFIYSIGTIDFDTYSAICGFLGFGAASALRAGLANSDPKMNNK